MATRIYFDACCLNRPFDDQSQARIRLETEATEHLLERTATHTRTVTAAQRRLFSLWLNNPLDAAVEYSTDEFAGTFGAQDTRDQIAHHYRRITGRNS